MRRKFEHDDKTNEKETTVNSTKSKNLKIRTKPFTLDSRLSAGITHNSNSSYPEKISDQRFQRFEVNLF